MASKKGMLSISQYTADIQKTLVCVSAEIPCKSSLSSLATHENERREKDTTDLLCHTRAGPLQRDQTSFQRWTCLNLGRVGLPVETL